MTNDEIFDCSIQFKVVVENQNVCKLNILRSDNGREFFNNKFIQKFLYMNSYSFTNIHRLQDGMSENVNRILLKRLRYCYLLFDSKFLKTYCAEAVSTAI